MFIPRKLESNLLKSLKNFPIVAIVGPRQVGKSSLAKKIIGSKSLFLDLELPSDLSKLEDAETFLLNTNKALVCIDEVQRREELFPLLRAIVDQRGTNGQYLILGSASPHLLRQSSESLAGRIKYLEMNPFILSEVGQDRWLDLWIQGGYPKSFLASRDQSIEWRQEYISTFLERDLPQLGFQRSSTQTRRFWTMLAHTQGQLLNQSKLAQSLDVSVPTIKSYINMLADSYMVRVLLPFHCNIKKRLVKSPKVYIRDSGLLHSLLEIDSYEDLASHPVYGASWEGFVIEQLIAAAGARTEAFFYRSGSGEEIDLILKRGNRIKAYEIKASRAPKLSKQNNSAMSDLGLKHMTVVAQIDESYSLSESVRVLNLGEALTEWEPAGID